MIITLTEQEDGGFLLCQESLGETMCQKFSADQAEEAHYLYSCALEAAKKRNESENA